MVKRRALTVAAEDGNRLHKKQKTKELGSCYLMTLPGELLVYIFSRIIDLKTILSLLRVCKFVKNWADDNMTWSYRLRLRFDAISLSRRSCKKDYFNARRISKLIIHKKNLGKKDRELCASKGWVRLINAYYPAIPSAGYPLHNRLYGRIIWTMFMKASLAGFGDVFLEKCLSVSHLLGLAPVNFGGLHTDRLELVHAAALCANIGALETLREAGKDLKATSGLLLLSPIVFAVRSGRNEALLWFVKQNIHPTPADIDKTLEVSATTVKPGMMRLLLEHCAPPYEITRDRMMNALRKTKDGTAFVLLQRFVGCPGVKTMDLYYVMIDAIQNGKIRCAIHLLKTRCFNSASSSQIYNGLTRDYKGHARERIQLAHALIPSYIDPNAFPVVCLDILGKDPELNDFITPSHIDILTIFYKHTNDARITKNGQTLFHNICEYWDVLSHFVGVKKKCKAQRKKKLYEFIDTIFSIPFVKEALEITNRSEDIPIYSLIETLYYRYLDDKTPFSCVVKLVEKLLQWGTVPACRSCERYDGNIVYLLCRMIIHRHRNMYDSKGLEKLYKILELIVLRGDEKVVKYLVFQEQHSRMIKLFIESMSSPLRLISIFSRCQQRLCVS